MSEVVSSSLALNVAITLQIPAAEMGNDSPAAFASD